MDEKSYNIRVPRRWVRVAMVVGVTALIVAPLTAIASHSFTDVPDNNTFHDDIAWLADAGVTRGCNPSQGNTRFCPNDEVTRDQMAAFMRRFAQYIDADDGTPGQADNADTLDGVDSTGFVRANSQIEGVFTCAGTAHTPLSASADYSTSDSLRYHISGQAAYRCNVHLPHGAVVNSVSFAVRDANTGTVGCSIWRTNIVTSIGGENQLATASTSGTPGDTVIADNTVEFATIDNKNYAYFTQCSLGGTNADIGLYGATVEYTHSPSASAAVSAQSADPSEEGSGE